ncbi:MAG: hypothetical protein ABSG41_29005 [Bryobacteraceae bacterium]|jgi:hypothetical protein
MHEEDALKYLIAGLRKGDSYHTSGYSSYGYDLYLPNLMREFAAEELGQAARNPQGQDAIERRIRALSPHFFAAAWELCRRGVIRPGIRTLEAQSTDAGSAGCGYSVTPFGRTWLSEARADDFVPTEPERFGQLLSPYENRFGAGFHERAQQAIRCYGAHAYLACCAMCGAAAESILLSIAIAKTGDEPAILKEYRAANGRAKIEILILGKARQQLQTGLRGFTEPLKYWRDESAHGLASKLNDEHAYTSLAMLLRLAQFSNDNWQELTQP